MKRSQRDLTWLILLLLLAALVGLFRPTRPPALGTLTFTANKGRFTYVFDLRKTGDGAAYTATSGSKTTTGCLSPADFGMLSRRLSVAGAFNLHDAATMDVGYIQYTLQVDNHRAEFSGPLDEAHKRVMDILTDSVVYRTMLSFQ